MCGSGVSVTPSPRTPLGLAPSLEPWCKDPAGEDGPEEPKVRQGDQGVGGSGFGCSQWDELLADRSAVQDQTACLIVAEHHESKL